MIIKLIKVEPLFKFTAGRDKITMKPENFF